MHNSQNILSALHQSIWTVELEQMSAGILFQSVGAASTNERSESAFLDLKQG